MIPFEIADIQVFLFELSWAGSKIIAAVVAVLTVVLVVRKVIDQRRTREWNDKRIIFETKIRGHLTTPSNLFLTDFKSLKSHDRRIFQRVFLQLSEDESLIQLPKFAELYEKMGLAAMDIRTLSRSPLWWKRAAAAHHLGQFYYKDARPQLVKALDDPHVEVRLEATWSLGHMRMVDELPKIVKSMSTYFKIAALRMDAFIFEMGKPALPILLDLCKHPEFEVRLLAIHLVGEFKDPESLPHLLSLLSHENLEFRMAACKALGTLGDPEGLKALLPLLQSPDWQLRAQAAKQLGRNAFRQAIEAMKKGLEDQVWWVRFNTGEAFSYMGTEGKEALEGALQSPDRFARDTATQWLDEMEARNE